MSNSTLAFIGRCLFALIFISSGLSKVRTLDLETGGPHMAYMGPKVDLFIHKFESFAGTTIPLTKDWYPHLLFIATALELAGAILFVVDNALGARMLLTFLIPVTCIMHNFWDVTTSEDLKMQEMIHFTKNLSLIGALLFYLGMKRR